MKRNKWHLLVFSVLILLMSSSTSKSPQIVDTNAKVKALFIYNFAKYVKWPDSMYSGKFTIGILGNYEALEYELRKMEATKKVNDQSFAFEKYYSPEDIGGCHILFVADDHVSNLKKVIRSIEGKNVLLVTDHEGTALQGSGINFIYRESKQKMEMNLDNITKYNLKVSKSLVVLSIQVQ